MPLFTYKGISRTSEQLEGIVEAYDELEAIERARELCFIVQEISPVKESKGFLTRDITKPKVKPKNLSILCAQFAIILQAGLPIPKAVSLVAYQIDDKYLKKVLDDVAEDVSAGHGLADSLENKGEYLPPVFIETIRAGEDSGQLSESFLRLQAYYEQRAKIGAKVAGALTYPIFVLIIAVVVVAVMMVFVIPAIANMVSSLGTDMPGITQFLIDISAWTGDNILIILVVILLAIVGFNLYRKSERGKVGLAKLQMNLPVLGSIAVFSGAGQFANTMTTLIAAGLPIPKAIRATSRVMTNYVLSKEVERMQSGLEEGKTLAECLEKSEYLPQTLIEMTRIGEQTGELEGTLQTIGAFYDSETQRVTDRALSLMEPALLVLMAIFAGFIVVALYLPMFTMYANM